MYRRVLPPFLYLSLSDERDEWKGCHVHTSRGANARRIPFYPPIPLKPPSPARPPPSLWLAAKGRRPDLNSPPIDREPWGES